MTQIVTRIEMLEGLLKNFSKAALDLIYASNGIGDNEWKTADGTFLPEYTMEGYGDLIGALDAARMEANAYFDPAEAEKQRKWATACTTASFVMDRYREDRKAAREHQNLIESSLHRNIAEAINGTLTVTEEDYAASRRPTTMKDRLNHLVQKGDLVEIKPDPPA